MKSKDAHKSLNEGNSLIERHALHRLRNVESDHQKIYRHQKEKLKFSKLIVTIILIIAVLIMLRSMF